MIPSLIFLLSLALLSALPLSAQVEEDVRLSPVDVRLSVLENHQTAMACTLGDRTMVVWGITVGDGTGGEHLGLMMGVQNGREWVRPPRMLATHQDFPQKRVRVIALDSVFVVMWYRGVSLYLEAWNRDGDRVSTALRLEKDIDGVWAPPGMPGLAVLMINGDPLALTYDGELRLRNLNPVIALDRSFQVAPDSSLTAMVDGRVVHYNSMFDTTPDWQLDPPVVDTGATANVPFIGMVSDTGFSIIVLVVRFSEGYSRYGGTHRASVIGIRLWYRSSDARPVSDTITRHDSYIGDVVPGFGTYREYRRAHARKYCGYSGVVVMEFGTHYLRAGTPMGPTTSGYLGVRTTEQGELTGVAAGDLPVPNLLCLPSGTTPTVTYEHRDGMTFIRVKSGFEDFVALANTDGRVPSYRNPQLVTDDHGIYVIWDSPDMPMQVQHVSRFESSSIVPIDTIEPLHLKDLSGNYGCGTRVDERHVSYFPGRLLISETQMRYCTVSTQGGPTAAPFAETRVSGMRDGRFQPLIWSSVEPMRLTNPMIDFNHLKARGFEPDDKSTLVEVKEDNSIGLQKPAPWIAGVSMSGGYQWLSTQRKKFPNIALPTGGTTWCYVVDDTVFTMDVDTPVDTLYLPVLRSQSKVGYQSLPGPYVLRMGLGLDSLRGTDIQLVDHQTGRVWEAELSVRISPHTLSALTLTHPIDQSRLFIWGGSQGIYAVRYSKDFQEELMPPARISKTGDPVYSPTATFINDTLTVVWEDHRHGIPAIYGLQWKVEAVEGTNSVDHGGTPATLDLSWRKSPALSEPME